MPDRERTNPFSQRGRTEELFFPNDVRLERIIISNGLRDVDVSQMLVRINIFEDLYNNVLSGSITLVDSVNLIGSFPFVGLEQVEIVFKTPGFAKRDKTELFFNVYQISDRITGSAAVGTEVTQTYTLQFISKAYFRNQQSRVRKAYTNTPISQMVKEIVGNRLNEDVDAEPTSGIQTFLIPSWTPFRAVNWLAARARPESHPEAANYLFYETVAGFQFRSINDIVQQTPTIRFVYDPANVRLTRDTGFTGERLIQPEIQSVRSYTILQSGSTMERIDQGMFASKLITHDIVTKEFTSETFSYLDSFPHQKHIEDNLFDDKVQAVQQDAKPFPGSARHGRKFDSVVKFYPKHTELFDGVKNHDESEKWLLQRMSQMRQIEAQRIKIETPGLNFLSVGQTVILEVPRPENVKGREHPDDRDPEISGNYVITNIHHILGFDDHKMVMELSKESLPPRSEQGVADILDLSTTAETVGEFSPSDVIPGAGQFLERIT